MPEAEQKTCEVCAAKVPELRRGRCWGCYVRWTENRPVGMGASCCMCEERRRGYLRSVELLQAWVPMCHNCAHRAMQMTPMPRSVEEIRQRLTRDRRARDRRGATGSARPDTRVFPRDRRGLERRSVGHARGDDLMLLDEHDIIIIDDGIEPDADAREETRIVSAASVATKPV